MPVYKYFCKDCKDKFEIEATIKEKEECCNPKFVCPKCKSKNVKQKFSLAAFFTKGKGCDCQGKCS
ncbi:MAG: zinc ribbon domain-containing protein [Candidatus Saganbacteria bacterium]|nr:zinc ribbon domain-containing protein [Candidatus Saganbacteria bacterium]